MLSAAQSIFEFPSPDKDLEAFSPVFLLPLILGPVPRTIVDLYSQKMFSEKEHRRLGKKLLGVSASFTRYRQKSRFSHSIEN